MKAKRQKKILELIADEMIETQDELASKLMDAGFHVTQATISRDIKDLRLVKTQSREGLYKYAAARGQQSADAEVFIRILRDTVTSVAFSENIIVVKTMTGSASAAAEGIDNLQYTGVLGTIAGDNTIFIATDSGDVSRRIAAQINEILGQ